MAAAAVGLKHRTCEMTISGSVAFDLVTIGEVAFLGES